MILEAHRRRVFRVAGLYVIGAWLVLQAADVVFPGLGIPEGAIRALLIATVLGFPVALVFGWLFDIGTDGIRRTPPVDHDGTLAPIALRGGDRLILAAIALIAGAIVYNATRDVLDSPADGSGEAGDVATELPPEIEHSVAVLPFENLSADPDNDYFSLGIAEEILNRLGGFQELNVIGRTSSFAFAGQNQAAPRISELLGAQFLLQGSVRREGNQVRISTQLLDARGLQVWAASFDRELVSVFAIQSEIADAVATTIVPRIVPQTVAEREPSLDSYQHFLRGRNLVHQRQVIEARVELERAIDLDPDYAEAHAELAMALLIGQPDEGRISRAGAAIDRALSLQPGMLRALEVRGLLLSQRQPPDDSAAEAILREVLSRDPDRADALNWLAIALIRQGREDEAQAVTRRGVTVDPLHPALIVNWTQTLIDQGEFELAEERLWRVIDSTRAPGWMLFGALQDLYLTAGQLDDLFRLAQHTILSGINDTYAELMFAYGRLGDFEQSAYWGLRTEVDYPEHWWKGYWGVRPLQMQGRYEEALRKFEDALAASETLFEDGDPRAQFRRTYLRTAHGELLALAGEFDRAIERLQPVVGADTRQFNGNNEWMGMTLAWCYLETGNTDAANEMLTALERLPELDEQPYSRALVAVLRGENDRALDLLETAVEANWLDYYTRHHDPRWDPIRDHPRFQALMAGVKARVDVQRERVAELEVGFAEKVDAMQANRRAANASRD